MTGPTLPTSHAYEAELEEVVVTTLLVGATGFCLVQAWNLWERFASAGH